MPSTNRALIYGAITIAVVAGGIAIWHTTHRTPKPPKGMVYTSSGFGGYMSAKQQLQKPNADPVQPAMDAYNRGDYQKAEAEAQVVVQNTIQAKQPEQRTLAARSQMLMAFSAARRKDLGLARDRFAQAQTTASSLPDKGKQPTQIGEVAPTIEEDAAYQHAVCTGALGDQKGAEAEYKEFMRAYPESPLAQAAVKRIGRLHGGNIPKDAEDVWKQAMATAQSREQARQRERSMCAPECLAELQRRKGETEDVHALAKEMSTSHEGTSLASLAQAAKKRGYSAKGLALTAKGLAQQKLPVVALVTPGHFVIVDKLEPASVTVWDPDFGGTGKPQSRAYTQQEWSKAWRGVVMTVE